MPQPIAYSHQPLRSPRSIRVINLKGTSGGLFRRAQQDQSLEVELEEISLDSPPSYEALSYTWGGQELDCPLRCHGKELKITKNCEIALLRLRRPSKRRLWIDSICIDQNNIEEKNAQIPLMGEVYGRAERVLVWLGEGTDASDRAIRYLKDVYACVTPALFLASINNNRAPAADPRIPDALAQKIIPLRKAFQEENKKMYGRAGTAQSSMLSDIFERSWFTRMWTVQELVLGFKASILCGTSEILWGDLIGALGLLVNLEHTTSEFHTNESVFWSQVSVYQQLRAVIHPQLAQVPGANDKRMSKVLTLAQPLSSKEPQDKLYALYGYLQILGVKNLPPVDYNLPVARVFQDYTKAAMLHDQSLELLYVLGGKREVPNLPSWTPDWSVGPSMWSTAHKRFSASKKSQLRFVFAEDDELHLAGKIIDVVKERASSHMPPEVPKGTKPLPEIYLPDIIQRIQTWLQWIALGIHLQSYPTGGERWDQVFLKIIVQNGIYGNLPHNVLSDEVLDEFVLWCNIIIGYHEMNNKKEESMAVINEAVDFALNRPAIWALYFTGDIDPLPVINTPEWRILMAVQYAGAQNLHHWIDKMTRGRTFFTTQNGYAGTGSDLIQDGDQIVLLAGMSLPMIVRVHEDGRSRFVASAYVHGIMNGEKWPTNEAEELEYFAFK